MTAPDHKAETLVARAICAERCAFMGEPPCWKLDGSNGDLSPECDDPGCMALAQAVVASRPSPATDNGGEGVSDERLLEILDGCEGVQGTSWSVQYDEIGNGPDVRLIALLTDDGNDDLPLGVIDEECTGSDFPSPILEHIARLDPATVRSIVAELLALRRSTLSAGGEADGWNGDMDSAPKDGTNILVTWGGQAVVTHWAERPGFAGWQPPSMMTIKVGDRSAWYPSAWRTLPHPHQIKESSE